MTIVSVAIEGRSDKGDDCIEQRRSRPEWGGSDDLPLADDQLRVVICFQQNAGEHIDVLAIARETNLARDTAALN